MAGLKEAEQQAFQSFEREDIRKEIESIRSMVEMQSRLAANIRELTPFAVQVILRQHINWMLRDLFAIEMMACGGPKGIPRA